MKSIIDTSEALGTVETAKGPCELCAAAEASYDETSACLIIHLKSFLRPRCYLSKERHFRAEWLPENETVSEPVSREESHDFAREIFHRWVRKVQGSAPELRPS